jgi:hypothetical protein
VLPDEPEIILPAKTLEDLVASARAFSRDKSPASTERIVSFFRELALADLDPIASEQVLFIVKQRTALPIAALREMLRLCRREVGTDSRAVAVADGKRRLDIGSDVCGREARRHDQPRRRV